MTNPQVRRYTRSELHDESLAAELHPFEKFVTASDHDAELQRVERERDGLLDAVERLNAGKDRLRAIINAAGLEGVEALFERVEAAEARLAWLGSDEAVEVVANAIQEAWLADENMMFDGLVFARAARDAALQHQGGEVHS